MINKEFLITGGTGSLGKAITKRLLDKYSPKGIRIYSRDELKQWQMKQLVNEWGHSTNVSFLIGDVRDKARLELAMKGTDIVIHAAAMKQVPACEENPMEAVMTNIMGSQNVVTAAINCESVEKIMAISTDKACLPINLYGTTKAAMEKLFIHSNVYSRGEDRLPRISCCRYGNVIGSRGSVIPLFREQARTGTITVTDPAMTRFWITLPKVAKFVLENIELMEGGEIFIPKMPSCSMKEIANAVAPDAEIKVIGIRAGEKAHEDLISGYESKYTIRDQSSKFIINGSMRIGFFSAENYDSFSNMWRLMKEELLEMEAEGEW